uniref:Secreted protein n=1 Tax=Parascaris univalens TaxID=6257 RepID=A0A915A3L3_PARUN
MILCRIASCSAPMRAFFLPKALVSVIFDTLFRWKQSLEKDETLILMLFKTHSRVLQQVQRHKRRRCGSELRQVFRNLFAENRHSWRFLTGWEPFFLETSTDKSVTRHTIFYFEISSAASQTFRTCAFSI